jgi:hypothetical protein
MTSKLLRRSALLDSLGAEIADRLRTRETFAPDLPLNSS